MTDLLPSAEHVLDVGMRRAVELTRDRAPVDVVARVLCVAGYAAELCQTDAPALLADE